MREESPGDVTQQLMEYQAGQAAAVDRLLEMVYQRLHDLAKGFVRREGSLSRLDATELLDEAMLRLMTGSVLEKAPNRRFFYRAASKTMQDILVDRARSAKAQKRGGKLRRVPLDDVLERLEQDGIDFLELHELLERLKAEHARPAEVVSLRFFGGLSFREIAAELEISESTAEKDWRFARAWLHEKLIGGQ